MRGTKVTRSVNDDDNEETEKDNDEQDDGMMTMDKSS